MLPPFSYMSVHMPLVVASFDALKQSACHATMQGDTGTLLASYGPCRSLGVSHELGVTWA